MLVRSHRLYSRFAANDELEIMWKEEFVTCFKILSHNLLRSNEKQLGIPQRVLGLRFKNGIFRKKNNSSDDNLTATAGDRSFKKIKVFNTYLNLVRKRNCRNCVCMLK
jgi:hypothetical protein